MQNLLDELKCLLQQDERLVVDGKLLKNKIIELGLQLDPLLLKMLLSHPNIKKHFFQDVEGILVFDKIKFQKFVSNKAFLPDSYTSFKNKIGLIADDEFIAESKEIVLAWPYKDCVLEGGQTKEDAKRNEIFWNEILAPDEIDRLLDPKVLTNFKKYDKDGEHPVTDISLQDNFIIKGNNLLALHSLKKVYAGKIKLIYIDPPYNTENDSFTYNDTFNHSTWLTFIKNRLLVAKDFLTNEGVIFISCDDNEQSYLKVLCDEIFGRENFISCLPTIMNLKGNNDEFGFAGTHEYTLVFAKNKKASKLYEFDIEDEGLDDWEEDEIGLYKMGANLKSTGINAPREKRPYLYYPILVKKETNEVTSISKDEYDKIFDKASKSFDDNYIEALREKYQDLGYTFLLPITGYDKMSWRWQRDKIVKEPYNIIIIVGDSGISIYKKQRPTIGEIPSQKPKTLFYKPEYSSGNGTAQIKAFFGEKAFKNPKPIELIKDFIRIGAGKNDIILDFFAGSGTTAQAILDLNVQDDGNRKFIICEQMDYVEYVTKIRVNKTIIINRSGEYIYCELAEANQAFIDQIQSATKTEELKTIWEAMKEKAFLSYKIDPKQIDLKATEFEGLSFEDQQKFLIEVLDKNMLYVPYSEIEDETYNISKESKALNRKFYGL